jgi:MFS family permease
MPVTLEPPPIVEEKQGFAHFSRVLRNRNFLLLWLAQLISLTVFNAANFGIIVLVNSTTHSVIMAGIAIISFTLPAVPFSAVAGVFVDRMNKRSVLWISNVSRAVMMLLIVASLLYDHNNLWSLFGLMFLTSLVGQFFIPAESASIPLLVGERELVPALSLFNITLTLSQAIGFLVLGRIVTAVFPPFTLVLGAALLHINSIEMLFVVVAFFYLFCAGLILCIPWRALHEKHLQKRVQGDEAVRAWEMLRRDLDEGWRIVRGDSLLFFSVVQLSVVGIIMLMIGELAGPFVQQILHRPPEDMSIIMIPAAVGLVGASVFMPRITEFVGKIRLTIIGFLLLSIGFLLLIVSQALALHIDPVHGAQSTLLLCTTVALLFILGIATACVNIPTQALMQQRTPEDVRGRVFSLQFMLYNAGSIPVLLFAGAIAQYVGLNQFIIIASLSMLVMCWWGALHRKSEK